LLSEAFASKLDCQFAKGISYYTVNLADIVGRFQKQRAQRRRHSLRI
jgi:hypothetical protein